MPHYNELYARYQKNGLEMIALCFDTDDRKEHVENILAKVDPKWPTWFVGGKDYKSGTIGEWRQRYSIEGFPMTLLIGRDGKLLVANPEHAIIEQTFREALGLPPLEQGSS